MNPLHNPFAPGAGAQPHELVGRMPILDQAKILVGRVALGRAERSMLITGLRGVGKTVLLNEIGRMAKAQNSFVIPMEAHEETPFAALLAPALQGVLHDIDRLAGVGYKVRRGLGVLRNFVGAFKIEIGGVAIGLDVEPAREDGGSGNLQIDLANLFVAAGEAAQERKTMITLLVDEAQYLNKEELGALIMAMHRMQQLQLPIALVGAGLPTLPGLAGDSKSYAERLFLFPSVGVLAPQEAAKALKNPVLEQGVVFQEAALEEVIRLSQGYPYFLQAWGYQCWNIAQANTITLDDVRNATDTVTAHLDGSFFRVRYDRLTPGDKKFLRAMAHMGAGPHRIGDVAATMGMGLRTLSPTRAKLIKKGMIYSPEHGQIAFTVPLFDEFMKRAIPEFTP